LIASQKYPTDAIEVELTRIKEESALEKNKVPMYARRCYLCDAYTAVAYTMGIPSKLKEFYTLSSCLAEFKGK